MGELVEGEATLLRRYERTQGGYMEQSGVLPRVEFNGIGDVDADGYDDVIIGTAAGGATSCDYCTSRSVILGGAEGSSRPHREFRGLGGVFGSGSPPVGVGDVTGDGLNDVVLHRYSGGFYVVHGSRMVEPIDLDGGGLA